MHDKDTSSRMHAIPSTVMRFYFIKIIHDYVDYEIFIHF